MEHVYKTLKPSNEKYKILFKHFLTPTRTGYVEIDNGVCVIPDEFLKYAKEYEEFEVRDTDIFVCGYPKTGTTWAREMVWMIASNLDFEGAKKSLHLRFPYFEHSSLVNDVSKKNDPEFVEPTELLRNMSNPRFIKSHFPWSLLPQQITNNEKHPKIIYIMRNPKDACVSTYYHHKALGFPCSFENVAELILAGRKTYGLFWDNVLSYWEQRNRKNLLIITFEEMKADLPKVIKQVANFLEKNLTEEQISTLAQHLSFESIKKNNAVNPDERMDKFRKKIYGREKETSISFIRSGKMGGYGSDMSKEMAAKFDEITKDKFSDIDFPYIDTMLL